MSTPPTVETFIDPTDGFTEITVAVDYHPGQDPMTIALSPLQARQLIHLLKAELDSNGYEVMDQ